MPICQITSQQFAGFCAEFEFLQPITVASNSQRISARLPHLPRFLMRTTILYFVAFISVSLSIQCFLDRNNHTFRHTSDKTTVDCSGNYCMKMVVEYDGAQETDWDCGDNICPEQAGSHQYHGRPEHTYCCQGAKCNTATAFQLIRIIFGIFALVAYRHL
ncbi:unnamed protein product, partial [Mesorhabditis spiculigera]